MFIVLAVIIKNIFFEGANAFDGPPTITQARVDVIYNNLRTIVRGRLAAHMIRAVFHDCTGPDGGEICIKS